MAKIFPIELLYSVTAGNTPTVDIMDRGTPAFNLIDKKMFLRVTTADNADDPTKDTVLEYNLTSDALANLSDVAIADAADGQALVFGDGKWKNVTLTSAEISDFVAKVGELVAADATVVHLAGAETISGVKTFSASPLLTADQAIATAAENELAKIGVVKAQTIYTDTSENGATVAIGGIAKGTKYDNANVVDIIDELLHPYVAPSGISLATTVAGGTFEMGNAQSLSAATVKWTNGSKLITKAEIISGTTVIGSATLSSSVTSASITIDPAVSISANTTYNARLTDATQETKGGSVAFSFVYPFYHGVVAGTVDAAAVAALTKDISAKGTKTYTYTTSGSQNVVVAFPASYGNLKSVLDPNGFETIDTFTKSTVAITGLDGTEQSYSVYTVSTNVDAFAYKFVF